MTVSVTTRSASRAGNGPPSGQGERKRERDGERDDAAHAGPGQDERMREQVRCAGPAAQERRHIGGAEDPQRPDSDQDTGHRDADADEPDRDRAA